MPDGDRFLTEKYDSLHASPTQEKLRKIAPVPAGVVFIQWPSMGEEDIRVHFRLMKKLGFSCLKGIMLLPGTDRRRAMHAALDEGLIPWWYGEGGWEAITDGLLDRLGVARSTPVPEIRRDPGFLRHQEGVMRRRIDRPETSGHARSHRLMSLSDDLHKETIDLPERAFPEFASWLRETYVEVEALKDAWNMNHAGFGRGRGWTTWEEVDEALPRHSDRDYRRMRDILKFKADYYAGRVKEMVRLAKERDPDEPVRAGGEISLYHPLGAMGWDMEAIAHALTDGGSFYPSIHLAWHFEEVDQEIARPIYMTASIMQDYFKGGWSAPWESTGGPQQLSGHKGLYPETAARPAGFTVDGGALTQFLLSYFGAGMKGFGLWCWSARTAGWETGEFALLDRNNRPSSRAHAAGAIGRAANRLRDELWLAHKEPVVGVFTDFENDAMWAAVSGHNRTVFRHFPMRARVGVSRALMNRNVPFEYVTATDLRDGLAGRYAVIYMPAVISISNGMLEILERYVEGGGRLVMDSPSAWLDDYGRMLSTDRGTPFQRIFGCSISDFQYSSNVPRHLSGERLTGFVLDLEMMGAETVLRFDDGRPAATVMRRGSGAGVLLGFEASMACFRPGNSVGESRLLDLALGGARPPFRCEGALAYRLASPGADHYFLVNDGPASEVGLETGDFRYSRAEDAVTGEALQLGSPVALPAWGARWVRLEKERE